jgi:hypothetical protein
MTSGSQNIIIGYQAYGAYTSGNSSTIIGNQSGVAWATGNNNTILGQGTTANVTGGVYNAFIGNNIGSSLTGSCNSNAWIGCYFSGPSGAVNDTGFFGNFSNNSWGMDHHLTTSYVWSFYRNHATGIHVYNTTDFAFPPTNYERALLDWVTTSNVLTIGTQAGGTGTLRNIKFVQGATNILDYGVTTANVWTTSAQITCTAAIKSTYRIANTPVTYTGTSVTMGTGDNSIIINASGTFTLTLLGAAAYPGRILYVKSIAAQIVNSAASNVVPIGSATAGTVIFPATAGKFAVLQSDGSNWITLASN